MTRVDQFESVFRSAIKETYHPQTRSFDNILIITDLNEAAAEAYSQQIRVLLGAALEAAQFKAIAGREFQTAKDLLDLCEAQKPDLICTYRCLHSSGWRYPHSLGEHLDVLLQKTATPVLVLPHPDETAKPASIKTVMAITDHLTSDHALIDHALAMTPHQGTLFLAHIEDEVSFNRMIQAISKIPSIDTDEATSRIRKQLLKEPRDYIASCRKILEKRHSDIRVEEIIAFGRKLDQFQAHIKDHNIHLLVMNTKDQDQQAMHGLAYPLAVELRNLPLLML